MTAPALVIGIGNADRGDDAVGLHVARRVAALGLPAVAVEEAGGDVLGLMDRWAGVPRVVLVDAAAPLAAPGRIHRLDAARGPLPREIALGSTHAFGLADTVELARRLGRLPAQLVLYAIEAADFAPGAPLSPAVAAAVASAAVQVAAEFGSDGRTSDA
ncbi:MAG: hydrogenase maturation protease [Rhodospirillales bacterium]|jgi:hydrogenase maturation protease|nr:hydrogenase maturation protease [Rhodospirillales bacterium]